MVIQYLPNYNKQGAETRPVGSVFFPRFDTLALKQMSVRYSSAIAIILILLTSSCSRINTVDARLDSEMPSKILWAWERPEDLRFLDPDKFAVAFLAQTLVLERDSVLHKPRRQPLEVPPGTYMIAVTRIETNKEGDKHASFDEVMVQNASRLIMSTLALPNVKVVQIDFDAAVSERVFYRELMLELKYRLDMPSELNSQSAPDIPLTMTSLASWCTGDAWFNDFPIDEAVPMVFQMGADNDKIRTFLRNGNDWNEPLCRGSYGVSLEEPLNVVPRQGRRMYYFKSTPWTGSDIQRLK